MRARVTALFTGVLLLGIQAVAAAPAFAATVSPNVNVTRLGGNQSEAAIAIDPTDPNHVVEFSNRLPSRLKLRGLNDKYLLRRLGRECLPDRLWERPKRPYRAPIQRSFFKSPTPDYVRELLSPSEIKASGLFRPQAVEHLVRKVAGGAAIGETDEMALAGMLSAQLLHRQFVTHFTLSEPISEDRDDIKICAR
jgi:asparagine synthase (glutamine-hydrolysing)